jgi:hypothetical protein
MLLDYCKGLKIVLSFAVFHGVLSELPYTILWMFQSIMSPEVEWMKQRWPEFND